MNTNTLKKFAREARVKLLDQVGRKLEYVLSHDTAELRGKQEQVNKLKQEITRHGKEQVIERVAYTWFNRLMAFRFMDANGYTVPKIATPAVGSTIPELLQETKAGHIDDALTLDRKRLNDLLDGRTSVADAQTEAYKILLVASCNAWHTTMPFMFERIADYTELLLPDDLLSEYSIVTDIRNGMSDEDCKQVEIIGWMYQFYISEKKDEVFERLAKNKKITPEDIPAATQLFTPNWIVRYLVENSLGRLWMLNHPNSKLIEKMQYYIKPEEVGQDFLKIGSPEEIKLCDPACGSAHMLVYAFALLYLIYEEEGYEPTEIPEKILTNNLYGIEIDERAGELSAFALTMVAREKYRRFFKKPIQPNICVLEKIDFTTAKDPKSSKNDLFSNVKWEDKGWEKILDELCKGGIRRDDLLHDLNLFAEADNYGSLVQPRLSSMQLKEAIAAATILHETYTQEAFLNVLTEGVLKALQQAEYLGKRYHVVIANPPYMGNDGMNAQLANFVKKAFPMSGADLMACFIERSISLSCENAWISLVNQHSWMFLDSFKRLRRWLIEGYEFESLLHLGARTFPEIGGEVVQNVAFTLRKSKPNKECTFIRLVDYKSSSEKEEEALKAIKSKQQNYYRSYQTNFLRLPDSPFGYWLSEQAIAIAENNKQIGSLFKVVAGISTGANSSNIFFWHETKFSSIAFRFHDSKIDLPFKPHNKGGTFKRWYGNQDYVIKYSGQSLPVMAKNAGFRHDGERFYFRESISWSKITSQDNSFRYYPPGFVFDSAGLCVFTDSEEDRHYLLGLLNSKVSRVFLNLYNPTLNASPGIIKKVPYFHTDYEIIGQVKIAISIVKEDCDSRETSWDFKCLQVVQSPGITSIAESVEKYAQYWISKINELLTCEESINAYFINLYGFSKEIQSAVYSNELSIMQDLFSCYEQKCTVFTDPMKYINPTELIKNVLSYFVGCLLGRYSLDKPGLILANAGEMLQDYLKQVPNPSFMPDEDNIIPVLEDEYFTDDIVGRFKEFLKVTFGTEHYDENLKFIEDAIGKDIRKYFVKDFYNDHIKRYKKRPIYWMFSSPKRTFNVLIYMHRYRPDTVSKILNDYLRAFIGKLEANRQSFSKIKISENASPRERTQADKKIADIESMLKELKAYEKTLYEVAAKKIDIDLDDGVKVNYIKFKDIVFPIKALEKDEE